MSEIEKANKVEAHRRAELIRMGMVTYAQTLETIAEAFAARDWVTLGYGSWDDYVEKEFAEKRLKLDPGRRREAAEALRLTGMSTRAIGSALGVHHSTVADDLRSGGGNPTPENVTGADGKTYTATRSPLVEAIADAIEETAERIEDQPERTPASAPAEATDSGTDPDQVRSVAAEGAGPQPAPSAPSPTAEFLANDPEIQGHNYAVAFAKALSRSGALTDFEAEKVAQSIGPETYYALEIHAAGVTRFFEKVRQARFGGPRLIQGESA